MSLVRLGYSVDKLVEGSPGAVGIRHPHQNIEDRRANPMPTDPGRPRKFAFIEARWISDEELDLGTKFSLELFLQSGGELCLWKECKWKR